MNRAQWIAALAAVVAVLALPHFVGAFGRSLAAELLIYSVFALSIGIIYGHTGMLSFGHAGFFGVGAYAVALMVIKAGAGVGLAFATAIVVCALLAVCVAAVAVQLRGHYFALITVIVGLILFYVATGWRSLTNAEDGLTFRKPELLGAYSLSDPMVSYYFFSILAMAVIGFVWFILLSPLGRVFRALRENDDRARYLGYRVTWLKMLSFVFSGALAGLAGGMYAMFSGYANSEFLSWVLSGEVVMWAMVGGAGSLAGPIVGASVLIFAREALSTRLIDAYPILVGIIIIGSVIFLRQGLVGALNSIAESVRRKGGEKRP
jgi:branched-chain amino acid transport system permease protein